jgi:rare lipoprotein A
MKNFLLLLIIIFFTGCYESDNFYLHNMPNYSTYNNSKKSSNTEIQKPYYVLGKWYYPTPTYKGQTFRGIASWYGPDFHGKLTANGEIYNMYAYTAANKTLPLGTIVKVTNLNNNKSVVVRVNDRGPFVKERIIDLSYAAGKKIGIDKTGTAPVKIVVISTPISLKYKNNLYKNKQKNDTIKIQIGAFSSFRGAIITRYKYKKFHTYIKNKNGIYKVYIGNFKTKEEANNFKIRNRINGFITKE